MRYAVIIIGGVEAEISFDAASAADIEALVAAMGGEIIYLPSKPCTCGNV